MIKKYILIFLVLSSILQGQLKNEFRAVWLTNVDSNVLETDESIAAAMDYLASIGINVVFPVVYNKGYTLYPSRIMDSLFNAPVIPDAAYQNRDFLKRLIIEAHRNGIEVIPWFEFGFATSYSLNGGHIINKFPHWALKNSSGNLVVKNGFDWMSAINPEAQDFIISLVTEVIDNYDVDGVQGDDRLPAMPIEGGYDSVTVQIYKSENGGNLPPANAFDLSWKRWRADKLSEFFQRLRDSVKVRNEDLILSSSPTVYPWGLDNYLQDSQTWIKNGIIDNIIPQLYRYDFSTYQNELNISLANVGNYNKSIYFAGILAKAGSYVIAQSDLINSVKANRSKGVNGECFFFYEGIANSNKSNGAALFEQVYQDEAVLPYRNGNIWHPKALIVNETDEAATQIGEWTTLGVSGFEDGIKWTNKTDEYTAYEYYFDVPYEAFYDVYAYVQINILCNKEAKYTYYSQTDSSNYYVDQTLASNKGWQKIGTVFLTPGFKQVLKIDNSNLTSGKYIIADAAMLMLNRKLTPDLLITDLKEKVNEIQISKEFKLFNNYPNPFNPTTNISFNLPEEGKIAIQVYDVLGRLVTKLFEGYKESGYHVIEFDGRNLSSGIYYYTIRFDNKSKTGKMILMK